MPSNLLHFYCSHARSSLHHIWPEYCNRPTSKLIISNPFPTLQPQSFWWNVNPFLIVLLSCLLTSRTLHFPRYGGWNVQQGPQAPRVWTLPARALFRTPAHWAAFSSKTHHTVSGHQDFVHTVPSALGYLTPPTPPVSMGRNFPSWLATFKHLLFS